ncbi:MAG TPA: hypothetical protein VHV53_11055 [Solirubrobacterales bacterium]|nr:hypothetical protein [Solirubrobacterales bacterium]
MRENLAYVFNGFNPPIHESWGFVLEHYPWHLLTLVHSDLTFGGTLGWQAPLWYLALAAALFGVFLLVRRVGDGDVYFCLHAYAILGGVVFVAFFGGGGYSVLRQELVLIPSAAVALALAGGCAASFNARRPEAYGVPPPVRMPRG